MSTPPFWARSGKMWPGCTRSGLGALGGGHLDGAGAVGGEMPVVTPSAASMDTVKLVP
jgi:hypothetical protein